MIVRLLKSKLFLFVCIVLLMLTVWIKMIPEQIIVTSSTPMPETFGQVVIAVEADDETKAFVATAMQERKEVKRTAKKTWRHDFDIVDGGLSAANKLIRGADNRSPHIVLLVTDDLSDPGLCSRIEASGNATDVIYFGGDAQVANVFFEQCKILDHNHACMNDRAEDHSVATREHLARRIEFFIQNYGIMRVSC